MINKIFADAMKTVREHVDSLTTSEKLLLDYIDELEKKLKYNDEYVEEFRERIHGLTFKMDSLEDDKRHLENLVYQEEQRHKGTKNNLELLRSENEKLLARGQKFAIGDVVEIYPHNALDAFRFWQGYVRNSISGNRYQVELLRFGHSVFRCYDEEELVAAAHPEEKK